MPNESWTALMGAIKNINENTNYMRKKLDDHITKDDDFKRDISLDLQNIHLTIDKKLDLFIEDQKIKNETFEKNDMKLSRAIEAVVKKLPREDINWKAFLEMLNQWVDNKEFAKKFKFTLKEKLILSGIIITCNAGLYIITAFLISHFGIDISKIIK
jgi:hypothetical protein